MVQAPADTSMIVFGSFIQCKWKDKTSFLSQPICREIYSQSIETIYHSFHNRTKLGLWNEWTQKFRAGFSKSTFCCTALSGLSRLPYIYLEGGIRAENLDVKLSLLFFFNYSSVAVFAVCVQCTDSRSVQVYSLLSPYL